MRRLVVFSLFALAACKRHEAPRDAPPPAPGASRGPFALTYYWTGGVGVEDRQLLPYRSIAVDRSVIPIGTHLFIEELAGVALPGTVLAHDGCVVADDIGGKILGAKIDLFVPDEAAYTQLDKKLHLTSITVFDGGERCH